MLSLLFGMSEQDEHVSIDFFHPLIPWSSARSIAKRSMSTVRPRKNYDRMEDKPLVTADEYDEDDPQFKSKTDQWLQYILHKLHALLWIVIATGIAIHTELFELIVDGHPPSRPTGELNRCAFFFCCAFFVAPPLTVTPHLSHTCAASGSTSASPALVAGC